VMNNSPHGVRHRFLRDHGVSNGQQVQQP